MKYVSIDIETLGLDSNKCDVIEFGAVIDDLESPIDQLKRFHCYLPKYHYVGEPYALGMHTKILNRIANREFGYNYIPEDLLGESFYNWLIENGFENKKCEDDSYVSLTVAGKNFFNFDNLFLKKIKNFSNKVVFKHRSLDPAILYFDSKTMQDIPSLDECLKLANIDKVVSHIAIDDAIDVIRCLRFKWNFPKELL